MTETKDLITSQDQEIKILELEEQLRLTAETIEALKEEKEQLRLHNQKLYATRVVQEVQAVEPVIDEKIDQDEIRSIWSRK